MADSITRALGVDQSDEEEMNLPLRDESGDESPAKRAGLRQNSMGYKGYQAAGPSKMISFCVMMVFIGIGVLAFIASARMAISPEAAKIGHAQLNDIETSIRQGPAPARPASPPLLGSAPHPHPRLA